MQEQVQALYSLLRSAWRFRWYSVALAWVVCLAGWSWVAVQKDVFQARTRVYIDTTSSLERVLDGVIIPADVQAQLNYVRQNLLGTTQLEEVARANDLHLAAETDEEIQTVVEGLRSRIRINSDGGGRRGPDNLYTIRYRDTDPGRAVTVVSTLLEIFVGDTRNAESEAVDVNQAFLRTQIQEYEVRLRDAEDRLARFKKENAGRLPGTEGGYFYRLQSEVDALTEARKVLGLAQSRRTQILAQLRGQSQDVPIFADGAELPPTSIEARIADGEAKLEALLLRFTDKHPDVVAQREQLDALDERLEIERAALSANGVASASLQSNPVYQALQISLNEVEVEIANLSADVEDRSRKVTELRALINEVPEVEAELARLDRDYEVVFAQYQALIQSLETENLSNAAQESDTVDFRMIDPPAVDSTPVEPQRARLVAMVLIAGLGLGGGIAFVLSQVFPVFTSRRDVSAVTGLPVLGAVSMSVSAADQRRRTLHAASLAVAVVALLCVFGGVFYLEAMGPGLADSFSRVVRA